MSSYDITFCSKPNCKNKECIRNLARLDELYRETHLIWQGYFEDCEYWEEEDE